MADHLRIDHRGTQRLEAAKRAFLVRSHQRRIARDIGGEDRGKPAGLGQPASPAAMRRPER